MSPRNIPDIVAAADEKFQLDWLTDQLMRAPNGRQFIIHTHISPGLWFADQIEELWKNTSVASYLEVFHRYQHKILFMVAGHQHTMDIRSPNSFNYTNCNISIFIAPSVSPYHQNNPGYTVLDINSTHYPFDLLPTYYQVKTEMRFFQLGEYILLRSLNFITTDPYKMFGFSIRDPYGVMKYIAKMRNNHNEYARYVVTRLGYRSDLASLASFSYGLVELFLNRYKAKEYLCSMENFEPQGY